MWGPFFPLFRKHVITIKTFQKHVIVSKQTWNCEEKRDCCTKDQFAFLILIHWFHLKLCIVCFLDALKKMFAKKAAESDNLLSSMYSVLGDTRLALMKSIETLTDWDMAWKHSSEEEIGIMELAEKQLEVFGKYQFRD